MKPIISREEAARVVDAQRIRKGLTWTALAEALGRPKVWTTSALLGSFPLSVEEAGVVGKLLDLDEEVRLALTTQPTRNFDPALRNDPTIYRMFEALQMHGPAIKALIHEEFGDGIMSAINFAADVERIPNPEGDRVRITLEGKFLDYRW